MSDGCPRCRDHAAAGHRFCGACGNSLADLISEPAYSYQRAAVPESERGGLAYSILAVACISVLAVAVFEAAAMLVHSVDIFSLLAGKSMGFIVIVPFPEVIFRLEDIALQLYWIFLVAVILACIVTTVWKFVTAAKTTEDIIRPSVAEKTGAFWVCVFLSSMMLINFVTVFITLMLGIETTVPDMGDKLEQMFLLADASVWEEIVTRVLYIGVPMMIISFIVTRKKESFRCLLGGFGMSMAAVALIIISAAIFGLAHYPGWDDQAWKVITTGIMGAFFGYMFVRFGLYAAILMHFITDYLSAFDWMGIGGFSIVITLALMAFGIFAIYYMFRRLWEYKGKENAIPNFRNGFIKNE